MIRKYHNHKQQTIPLHLEEEPPKLAQSTSFCFFSLQQINAILEDPTLIHRLTWTFTARIHKVWIKIKTDIKS